MDRETYFQEQLASLPSGRDKQRKSEYLINYGYSAIIILLL